ncbi:hypothetical protein ABT364_05560 [Massilia sp. SR12]
MFDATYSRLRRMFKKYEAAGVAPEDFYGRNPRAGKTYEEQFGEAARFSAAIGAPVAAVEWQSAPVLHADTLPRVEQMLRAAGVRDLRDSAQQCLKWSAWLQPHVERTFNVPAILTIGQLWYEDKALFSPDWGQLHRMYANGFTLDDFGRTGGGVNFHAWLTLGSGEIFDFTLLSSLALALPRQWGPLAGHALGGYPEEVMERHRFVPMVLGSAYAERVSNNSPVRLLARGPEELSELPQFLAAVPIGFR